MDTDSHNAPHSSSSSSTSSSSPDKPKAKDARKPFVKPELRREADLVEHTATTAFS